MKISSMSLCVVCGLLACRRWGKAKHSVYWMFPTNFNLLLGSRCEFGTVMVVITHSQVTFSDGIDDGRQAFNFPPSVKNLPDKEYPHSHAWWWLLGTGGYVSRTHVDAEGAGTAIMFPKGGKPMAGKLWFLARPKEEQHDMNNNTAIPNEYNPHGSNRSLYFWEAVFLREGDLM